MMKLHMVGEKVIPKIIDEILYKFDREFELLSKNKQTLLKVFSAYRYLPLNYNTTFFNRLHSYLKSIDELPSHVLLYLPYNKLSEKQISYLQTKMFTQGREDIVPKLIYTIYEPFYKDIMTPFIVKEAYTNLLEMFKKDSLKQNTNFQAYIAVIFRLSRVNNPIIQQNKLKQMFKKLVEKI